MNAGTINREQEAGRYRLKPRNDGALFGYAAGLQSWKKYLHLADVKLFEAEQTARPRICGIEGRRFDVESAPSPAVGAAVESLARKLAANRREYDVPGSAV